MEREPYYILNDDHSVTRVTFMQWARWYERTNGHVAHNVFGHEGIGEIKVSTVFLGLDHNFFGQGPPLLFETMIFGGGADLDGYQTRCSTWDEALQMHADACAVVKNAFTALAQASGA